MVIFKKNLNRYYDTKAKKIVSKKYAKNWAIEHGKIVYTHQNHKKSSKYARPSYKKMYKHAELQVKLLERQFSVGKFHPFIVNKTKHGEVTPETNYKDVIDWSHDHGGKLFVVAALGNDDQSIVKACGSVHKNEVAGFGTTELLPQLISEFENGYND